MQPANLLAVLFIVIFMIMAGVYVSRRNTERPGHIAGIKQLSDSDDVTESEPELEMKEKEIDKMEQIPEENNNLSDGDASINPEISDVEKIKKRMRKKNKKKNRGDNDDDDASSSDSDDYSMQRMVEEYQKSRTLAKRFSEVIEDISDTFKRKSIEIRRKFEPASPPAVIKPMSFAERQAMLGSKKASNDDNAVNVSIDAFDANFDDEKQPEVDTEEQQHLMDHQDDDEDDEAEEEQMEEDDVHGKQEDVVDSQDEDDFADFDAQNYKEFDAQQFDRSNGAIEVVVSEHDKKQRKDEKREADRVGGSDAVEIPIDDEKVNERQHLVDNTKSVES